LVSQQARNLTWGAPGLRFPYLGSWSAPTTGSSPTPSCTCLWLRVWGWSGQLYRLRRPTPARSDGWECSTRMLGLADRWWLASPRAGAGCGRLHRISQLCSNVCSNPGGTRRHVAASGGSKRGWAEPRRPLAACCEPSATTVRDR